MGAQQTQIEWNCVCFVKSHECDRPQVLFKLDSAPGPSLRKTLLIRKAQRRLCVTNQWRFFRGALYKSCAKWVSLPLFLSSYPRRPCLPFSASLANTKGKRWHLLALGLFVFLLSFHCMSTFMSSLGRNIKEAHSLLILTVTIQSFRHTAFAARAPALSTLRNQVMVIIL